MQVLQYLLDDVSLFLTTIHNVAELGNDGATQGKGCMDTLKAFLDYISGRERENFHSRKHDNQDSVTLTTIHQVLLHSDCPYIFLCALYDAIACSAFCFVVSSFVFCSRKVWSGTQFSL